MCGIAGILKVHPAGVAPPPPDVAIPDAWLDILDDSIKHRGPDGQGRFRDRATRPDGTIVDVAFVHRRLSIIDHAGGHQPMVSERGAHPDKPRNGRVAVVFNGCIYNHRDLRRELQSAGHQFVTDHSDTEVLVHGWREWGFELCHHLDGMYAMAIWDQASAGAQFVVDTMGEKPLYFSHDWPEHTLVSFASTLPALARLRRVMGQNVVAEDHPFAMSDLLAYGFLTGQDHWGFSPIKSINRVGSRGPLGAFAANGRLRPEHHPVGRRIPSYAERSSDNGDAFTVANIEQALQSSVETRLESDVPTGCFLSGGIDSSLVSLYAKRLRGDVRTFCIRMPAASYDESPVAEEVARHIGTTHTTLECDADPSGDLVTLIRELGIPFGDSSLLPTHWVSKAAKSSLSVALSGDGGDELFCGYERYRAAKVLQRWSSFLSLVPSLTRFQRREKSRTTRIGRLVQAAKDGGYPALLMIFPPSDLQELVGMRGRNPWPKDLASDSIAQAVRFDILNYLPGDLLTKVDTAAMAVALEVRAPFLSSEIVHRSMKTPISTLMLGGKRKGLLRYVASQHFPPDIVDRPKMGFSIPIGEWFRTDYGGMRQLLLDTLNGPDPFPEDLLGITINRRFVSQMVNDHMSRRRDHSQRLYMLLVLAIWAAWLRGINRGSAT
ncbi:MAG: asparagine synthase (glutamine-hydrolyzing) [Phycisphaerales bacterium]|nr:asparagine synthase (glutamine-hydrolyzing) [Phycisphaerales bacterium]